MNWDGIVIGIATFLMIGVFHPIVIKTEYYFTARVWPVFLVAGILFCILATTIQSTVLSAIVAVVGFSSFWSILELKHQEKRVEKGWFPENPNRKK